MSKLFEPSVLAGLLLKNRSVRSATWEGLADAQGFVRPELVHMLRELARGGVGLIITGYLCVSPEGRGLPYQTGVWQDSHVEGLRRIARAVHNAGGLVAAQIAHAGGRTRPEWLGGLTPIAPSAIKYPAFGSTPRKMTAEDILDVVEKFAEAARRVKRAGFDAVQLHAAHGYLLSQFLSPLTNRRNDDYGGSPKKRHRFILEVYNAVRGAVGPHFPVFVKMNSVDGPRGGIEPQNALETAEVIAAVGVDGIEISGGLAGLDAYRPARRHVKKPSEEAYFRPTARLLKENLDLPVILVGGIKSYEVAEDILESGDADYVSFSRPLICEPHLILRWMQGERGPAKCLSCNNCLKEGLSGRGIAACKASES